MNTDLLPNDNLSRDYIIHKVKNAIQDTLLFHAPERAPAERLEAVEKRVLLETRKRLDRLADEEVTLAMLGRLTWIAESDTKELIMR